jgi:peptidoglycan-associated lipoprotein
MLRKISIALMAFSLALGFAGCKSAQKTEDTGSTDSAGIDNGTSDPFGSSDAGNAMGLKTVYFKYDSFEIDPDGKAAINNNAGILKANSGLRVQIEGHCDQRGGIQYNLALGEKRANAVKNALSKAGISGDRITTISYGKEKPIDTAMTEDAYAKNRRGNFVITSK